MGLWRNLPVRSQPREEEPAGCGSPDKGDINTLTLDLWSLRRRGRRESESRGLRGGGVLQDKEGACVCQLRALVRERCLRRGGNSHTLLRG